MNRLEGTLERERSARRAAERLLEVRNRKLEDLNRALVRQCKLNRVVFDTAADGILVFDADGRIELVNQAARHILGISGVVDQSLGEFLPQELLDDWMRVARAADGETSAWDATYVTQGCRADGTVVPLECRLSRFQFYGDVGHSCILRDLTHRRQLEAQLALSQKMEAVGRLASGVAHEINTPIQYVADNTRYLQTSIAMLHDVWQSVESLLDAATTLPQLHAHVEEVRRKQRDNDMAYTMEELPAAISETLFGAESVAEIVRSMKAFAHPTGGEADWQDIDIHAALESALTVCRHEWKHRAIIVRKFSADVSGLRCLPGELNQVFLNLIVNAAQAVEEKWAPQRGRITLRTSLAAGRVRIEIMDNGPGIAESIRRRVFDPFFTTKGVGQGTGQGLAMCHRIVTDRHGATLSMDTTVGEGTTFRIEFPSSSTLPRPEHR